MLAYKNFFIALQNTLRSFLIKEIVMETNKSHNQIIITMSSDVKKQKLPLNLLISLIAGAIAGMVIIFGLFWGAEVLFNI